MMTDPCGSKYLEDTWPPKLYPFVQRRPGSLSPPGGEMVEAQNYLRAKAKVCQPEQAAQCPGWRFVVVNFHP